jgi:AraC family transcriptional activator FtrA
MHVGLLILEGMRSFDVAIAVEVFSSGVADGAPRNEVVLAGPRPSVQLSGGLRAQVEPLDALATAELILIPGFAKIETRLPDFDGPDVRTAVTWLRAQHARGATLAALCTGTFLLAETGLLDGSSATTHWRHAERLALRYPQVRVDPAVIHLHDDQRRLWTSAGVTAGVDMCLALIRHFHGAAAAAIVARSMVLPVSRSGGQAQFIPPRVSGRELPGAELDRLRHAVAGDLASPWPNARLAATAGVAGRTLQRRFAELGISPSQWLIEQRVVAAQELLESSDLSVEQIAGRVGFGSADLLRKHFAARVSVSPSRYRESFRQRPR